MSVGVYEEPQLAGDDGSGDASDWERWQMEVADDAPLGREPAPIEGSRGYAFRPEAPRRLGGMTLGAFSPEAAGSWGMPQFGIPGRLGGIVLRQHDQ
jgi:hypothetical protein